MIYQSNFFVWRKKRFFLHCHCVNTFILREKKILFSGQLLHTFNDLIIVKLFCHSFRTSPGHIFQAFHFLKLSKFKQLKSFVKIRRNLKVIMALNNKEWPVKTYETYIHQSAMKIFIIHSQHSLPFSSIKMLFTKNLNLTICFRYNLRFKK